MFDTLIINAKIYSLEKEGEIFSAMGIKDGKIIELFEKSPENSRNLGKKIIDAKGYTVLPGLIDSHVHFMMSALICEVGTPISEIVKGKLQPTSLNGIKEKVQAFAAKKSTKQALIFTNVIVPSIDEGHLPYREQIDEWLPGRIAMFSTIDGHAFSLSTLALEKIGIDPVARNHNGILTEDMPEFDAEKLFGLITDHFPMKSMLNGIKNTLNEAIRFGIVDLHCLDGVKTNVEEDSGLKFMFKFAGKFPLYIHLYPQIRDVSGLAPYLTGMKSPRVGGCFQWEVDGAVGARTAAFYEPYIGEPENFGAILYPKEELSKYAGQAYRKGFQITAHAIGTRAIDELLDVYEDILKENSDFENTQRLRIDHFEFPSKAALDRAITKLNLIIVPQPGFNWINYNFSSMKLYEKYLKPEIVALQNPLRSIVERGGIICGSTDSPIQSLNPFLQIHGMVNFPIENESLSVYEAFRTYTYNGAYATHSEKTRGTLAVGKWADFIMMEENPFTVAKESIIDLKVNSTYIGGKLIKPMKGGPWKFLMRLLFSKNKKI
ncbi:MAG: amidohydrolase [Promethearchaeota archaeon]